MTTGWTIFCIVSCIMSFWIGYATGRQPHTDDLYDIEGE